MIGAVSPNIQGQLAFAERIARLLAARGGREAYLVGGYVRALIMNTVTRDFDIVVAGGDSISTARQLADDLGAEFYVLDAGREYGRVVGEDSKGPHAFGEFTIDVIPAEQGSIERDLLRRDFTIDAMALPIDRAGDAAAIIDPNSGLQDIDRKSLRAVDSEVFRDDPARLLRLVRLAAQLGFTVEDDTLSSARASAPLVRTVSHDRQRDELCRILGLARAAHALVMADEMGLLSEVLPEIDETRGVEQPREHYWDVFNHLLQTVRSFDLMLDDEQRNADGAAALLPWNDEVSAYFGTTLVNDRSRGQLTKLACLLHDIAKPATKTVQPDGRMRFFGHGEEGAGIASEVMERLRFSRRETRFVSSVVTHHLRPVQLSQDLEPPSRRAVYRYREALGDAGIAALYLSMADYLAAKGPMLDAADWRTRADYCSTVLTDLLTGPEQEADRTEPLVNGRLLMDELGLKPGKELGRVLAAVHEAVAVGDVETRGDALDLARRLAQAATGGDAGRRASDSGVRA